MIKSGRHFDDSTTLRCWQFPQSTNAYGHGLAARSAPVSVQLKCYSPMILEEECVAYLVERVTAALHHYIAVSMTSASRGINATEGSDVEAREAVLAAEALLKAAERNLIDYKSLSAMCARSLRAVYAAQSR
jgi:hypothetical protein